MNTFAITLPNLNSLESRLTRTTDAYQRLELLQELCAAYAYLDSKKASKYLAETEILLEEVDNQDFRLSFYMNTAIAENQIYNYNLSDSFFKKAIELLEERGDTKQQIEGFIDYSGTCINRDELDRATTYLDKAAKALKNFPDPQLEARHLARMGLLQQRYANFLKSSELLLEADKQILQLEPIGLKDSVFRVQIQSALGRVYERTDDVSRSLKAFEEAVELSESLEMRTRLSWHYLNAGNAYMRRGRHEKAELFFEKAIKVKDDISLEARAGAYANLGVCQVRKGKYQEALKLYRRAETIYKGNKNLNYTHLSKVEMRKAQIYIKLERNKKVEKHFSEAIRLAHLQDDSKQLSKVCEEVAEYNAQQGNHMEAYQYLKLHNSFKERHLEQTKQQQLTELEFKYAAEKKKQEAEMLKLQSVGLQLKALRSQMNPHFMYNALNSIQRYITSQELNNASKYLAKFARLMRQSLEYSDFESISLEKEIEFLENYLFISQKLRFGDRMDYQISVDDEIEEDIMGVPTMIVQPYVENSIEHGLRQKKNGMIKVDFKLQDDNTIICTIEDNGIGREAVRRLQELDGYHNKHESRGTSITEKRLQILNKSKNRNVLVQTTDLFDPETNAASGTRVEILIPVEIIQKP